MKLSVIIPVLNERTTLPDTLTHLESNRVAHEIIVVDGGSDDGTREWLATQSRARVVHSARGRGAQLNAGARQASGDTLLFLHGDCTLPHDAAARLKAALSSPAVVGGAFHVRFAGNSSLTLRAVAAGINVRSSLRRSATGDQAIFVRRSIYDAVGGFAEWPLFEDVDFVTRIKRLGRFVVIPSQVPISPRRYLNRGIWSTVVLIHALRAAYWAGVSPFVLASWFTDVRPHISGAPRPSPGWFDTNPPSSIASDFRVMSRIP